MGYSLLILHPMVSASILYERECEPYMYGCAVDMDLTRFNLCSHFEALPFVALQYE